MSLNVWRLALPLFLIMVIPGIANSADQPDIFDAVYDIGSFMLKWKTPADAVSSFSTVISGHTITAEIPLGAVKAVPFGQIKAVIENPPPQNWYDPFWDSYGWGMAKDWASIGSMIPGGNVPFSIVGGFLTLAQYQNDAIIKAENELGITDFWLSAMSAIDPSTKKLLDSASESVSSSSKLAQAGIGTPQLSPSSGDTFGFSVQNTNVPETSDATYIDKANNVWYVDALSWSGDRNLLERPAAPYRFASGEINTYGYNWIYLPYSRTGISFTQGYAEWAADTLASMGISTAAGYGLLVDEGQNGGDGW